VSATDYAVVMADTIPVFVDIDKNLFCLSSDAIKKIINKKLK
jgi:dTDP-4-amino-4,6-dideoxygalactose transaminase